MTIPTWSIPLLLTIGIWCWGLFMPPTDHQPTASFDLSGYFSALFRIAVCVVGTLTFWLAFFVIRSVS